ENTNAELVVSIDEKSFDRQFFTRDRERKFLTIAWNKGDAQKVAVDEVEYDFPENSILPLMVNQSFRFEKAENVVAWQFNRDFYCIADHDKEVGCIGFLFYGSSSPIFIELGANETRKINLLLDVFKDEFENVDNIQSEMLRILLVRLIITITRLAKSQRLSETAIVNVKFDLIRQFHLLVENHYRSRREVNFYASKLHKSPKTLANYFALCGQRTPLQIIQERIILEAKRLFNYTDKTSKEIAFDLGFDDAAHFSRFFKNQTQKSPSEFKKATKTSDSGSIGKFSGSPTILEATIQLYL
ncbi:MAG: helix-turn-helix domain-containing protein, partial [Pyrinomonadaceae bacterium]|nr:helix-turn-helix domain-containing protein [Pyrinomonadaceae bacterium]